VPAPPFGSGKGRCQTRSSRRISRYLLIPQSASLNTYVQIRRPQPQERRMDLIKGTPCEAAIEKAMQLAR
jgi:hypothetical protein